MKLSSSYFSRLLILSLAALMVSCGDNKLPDSNQVVIKPNSNGQNITGNYDKSPMDMSYYPVDYPKLKMTKNDKDALIARVIYSRPKTDGRVIFGNVLKYGSPWRMGANEATEIEFFRDVEINDRRIEKGRYVIYCIPQETEWKMILNNDLFTWGLQIDSSKDVYSFTVPVVKNKYPFELLTIEFAQADESNMRLNIAWDSVRAVVPIKY